MSADATPALRVDWGEGLAWLTLNRPRAANALNAELQTALVSALAQADQDASIRAIVLAASGGKVFSAGADLKEHADRPLAQARLLRRRQLRDTTLALAAVGKPVIACVRGKAIGAGAMLALLADELVCAPDVTLSLPEIHLGSASPLAIAVIMSRANRRTAYRLVQTGEVIGAAEGLALGLVDRVTGPQGGVEALARERAQCLGALPSRPHGQNRRWMNRGLIAEIEAATGPYSDQIDRENDAATTG